MSTKVQTVTCLAVDFSAKNALYAWFNFPYNVNDFVIYKHPDAVWPVANYIYKDYDEPIYEADYNGIDPDTVFINVELK